MERNNDKKAKVSKIPLDFEEAVAVLLSVKLVKESK